MRVIVSRLWKSAFALIAMPVFAAILLSPASIRTSAKSVDFDAAAFYTAKCAMCHGPKAEKKFNAALPDDQQLAAILSGKKGVKPPNMPEFQSKGVTTDQATALLAYMKSLKP